VSATTEFFANLQKRILTSINTAMPAKILSFDEVTCTAKIQPLFKVKEEGQEPKNLPAIEGVPALKQKYRVNGGTVQTYTPVYNVGDVVLVVFSQRALDSAKYGNTVYPGANRMFSIHDAVIVGLF
jgi:hypothetical protein